MPSTIHIVHKTHLDVGYTDFAARVLDLYSREFIPKALDVARELREHGGRERLVWTVSSWLVERYLSEASSKQQLAMTEAIVAGDIAWLGLPFTFHGELVHPDLFRYAISICRRLDERFGRHTTTAKVTDVPGITVGAVPLLVEAGIECLFIGANGTNRRPDLPDVFRWQAPDGREIVVVYQNSYGGFLQLPHTDEAVSIELSGDNVGPPTRSSVVNHFLELGERFPNALLRAGTLDDAARTLRTVRERLPVFDGEIGDLWIYGAASDPWKVARYRELCRFRREAFVEGKLKERESAGILDALLLIPEHTWGLDQKVHLADFETFEKHTFSRARQLPAWRRYASSWTEQRQYLDRAIAQFTPQLASEAQARIAAIDAPHSVNGYEELDSDLYQGERFAVRFDAGGAIVRLDDRKTGCSLASPEAPICRLSYQVFDAPSYERYWNAYLGDEQRGEWFVHYDYGKPGLERLGSIAESWTPTLSRIEIRKGVECEELHVLLTSPAEPSIDYGCPRQFDIQLILGNDGVIALTVSWRGKDAIRVPEAIWCAISLPGITACRLDKVGTWIDPLSTVRFGGHHNYLHAIHERLALVNNELVLDVESLDAPLVSIGRPAALELPEQPPSIAGGVHFNLLNTCWGTNFPAWCEDDTSFRFVLRPNRTPRSALALAQS